MPLEDWQFWLVTGVALWRLTALAKEFLPRSQNPDESPGSPCAGCAMGQAACRQKNLTG